MKERVTTLGNEANREIMATGVVVVMRGNLGSAIVDIVQALYSAGIRAIEVTMNSPGAANSINCLAKAFGTTMSVGSGTVLSSEEAQIAFDAGATFIVSPNIDPSVIEATKKLGMASYPGAATCTEMLAGLRHGADAIKIFPASAQSPTDLQVLRGPLGDVRFIPTGGITPELCEDYIAHGAWAVGVGSNLVNAAKPKPLTEIEREARKYLQAVAAGKSKR
jgi:2-dehydro-3-deoxyphosphogluconate aldolase/(4S)-4-hydroxy-2-oxoglutarate aldolase